MTIINEISYLDSVLKEYGDVSYIFHYAELNGLDSIQGLFSAGTEVITDDFRVIFPIVPKPVIQENPIKTITITGIQNQNIFDISTRYFGNLLKTLQIARENGLSITDSVSDKQILVSSYNVKADIVNYYEKFNSVLATNNPLIRDKAFNKSFNISFR